MATKAKNKTYLVKVLVVAEQTVSVKDCSNLFDAEFMAVEKIKKEVETGTFQIPLLMAEYTVDKSVVTELDV